MTAIVLPLASLSVKIAVVGAIAWMQLFLLRRAPAASRSRLCALALVAIVLLTAGEALAPNWMVKAPVYNFTASSTMGTSPAARTMTWSSLVGYLWMAGVAFMLLRALVGRAAIAMARRRSVRVEGAPGIEVRIGAVQTPVLTGWQRPTILLPESAREWTEEQRGMVLVHEITHFRQGDVWTLLLAQAVRAAFWFHPAVWLLVSRLSREQELTCDEAVVAAGHSPHDYAAFLLDAVRNLRSGELFACAMAGSGARSLQRRFANLLDPTPRRASRAIAAALASLALLAMALTVVRPVWSQSEKSPSAKTVWKMGNGVTPPRLLHKIDPQYTQEAKAAKIEGTVVLKTVINEEGTAEQTTVVRSLDPGLDQKAVDALSTWTFQPGTKDGKAVAVWANVEVHFRLK